MSFFERHQMRGISGKSSACAARQLKFGGWVLDPDGNRIEITA